ncbi:MAG TPA: DUF6249 domain-containing protein [Acidobacteriaceae bacterium]|nr:DUF6249 domain-containing protein [Acidobacteriaceae bacterium]
MGQMFENGLIVPVAAFFMALGIILIVNITNYHLRKLQSRERLAAIEKGVLLPESDPSEYTSNPRRTAARTRLTAIILIAVGIGTALAFAILALVVRQRDVLAVTAFAVIPLAIGIGMLFDYRLQSRALESMQSESNLSRLSS